MKKKQKFVVVVVLVIGLTCNSAWKNKKLVVKLVVVALVIVFGKQKIVF